MSTQTPTTNLLLVDDDPVAATVTEHALQRAPASVQLRIAGDGIEAYRYIRGTGLYTDRAAYPLPDVILLDINMPSFDGLEFLRWLREHAPENSRAIPVVLVSSSGTIQEFTVAHSLGVKLFIPKPVKWPEFWEGLLAAGLLKLRQN
jgi:CheY-like chemotaxis protein